MYFLDVVAGAGFTVSATRNNERVCVFLFLEPNSNPAYINNWSCLGVLYWQSGFNLSGSVHGSRKRQDIDVYAPHKPLGGYFPNATGRGLRGQNTT